MPMMSHSAVIGDPWHRCDRCGNQVRTSQLRRQDGVLVCTQFGCYDSDTVRARDNRIALVEDMLDLTDEAELAPILQEPNLDEDDVI